MLSEIMPGKRKNRHAQREYQNSWEFEYFASWIGETPIFLICQFVFNDKKFLLNYLRL